MSARDERRERYAAAVLKVKNLAGLFADVRAHVDPVMAVADAEIELLRAELASRPVEAHVLRQAAFELEEHDQRGAADLLLKMANRVEHAAAQRPWGVAEQGEKDTPTGESTPQPCATCEHAPTAHNRLGSTGGEGCLPCLNDEAAWLHPYTPPKAAPQPDEENARRAYLRQQITAHGGRWKSGRAADAYTAAGIAAGQHTARKDLAALAAEGFLKVHEVKGARYYTLKGGA
ncbi:hypothetical protein J7I98_23870 [Streptomyces sp. ISL-98]|uniref:hypothetical protein n=1 Tax=Streptomyces sp. ISL-98 TaxID=2819192 RepID=UPI001BEB0E55|nr:hypothetical protein [Streptomyces sp. ISL-98]MBT2508869.1 hypothetical protein [Streptomyces sp. ISL-98]